MYKGVWKGKYADDGTRILILGESHYCSEGDSLDTTTSVIKRFLEKDDIPFFEKIVESLGYRADERETLFDLVFFGNYIDELCGIGDAKAKEYARKDCEKYNDELFSFVNENKIDVILSFSKLAYDHLPVSTCENKKRNLEGGTRKVIGNIGQNNNVAEKYEYVANVVHNKCNIALNRDLVVYALRHPSGQGGYSVEQAKKFFMAECEELKRIIKIE